MSTDCDILERTPSDIYSKYEKGEKVIILPKYRRTSQDNMHIFTIITFDQMAKNSNCVATILSENKEISYSRYIYKLFPLGLATEAMLKGIIEFDPNMIINTYLKDIPDTW